jgi:hypothetical protein
VEKLEMGWAMVLADQEGPVRRLLSGFLAWEPIDIRGLPPSMRVPALSLFLPRSPPSPLRQ